jgi:hypothetical protein
MPRTSSTLPARLRHWAATGALLMLAGVGAGGCSPSAGADDAASGSIGGEPAHVEVVEGTDLGRITLTRRAAERLGLETAAVAAGPDGGTVIPYSALIYDAAGGTWAYTAEEPLVYQRAPVTVRDFDGDQVVLADGPPAGTSVVTVGAALLLGEELDVGH